MNKNNEKTFDIFKIVSVNELKYLNLSLSNEISSIRELNGPTTCLSSITLTSTTTHPYHAYVVSIYYEQ